MTDLNEALQAYLGHMGRGIAGASACPFLRSDDFGVGPNAPEAEAQIDQSHSALSRFATRAGGDSQVLVLSNRRLLSCLCSDHPPG